SSSLYPLITDLQSGPAPVTERPVELPPWRERARLMFTAKQYRAKAAEYTELLKATSLPAEILEFRRLERSCLTLAENEEWMADNREKNEQAGCRRKLVWRRHPRTAREAYARMSWGRRGNAVRCHANKDSAALR